MKRRFTSTAPSPVIIAIAGLAAVLTLGACGSSNDSNGAGDDVASIGSDTDSDTDSTADATDESTETSIDPEEAFNEYTQCMRDEGIDMPDAQVFSADDSGQASGGVVDINTAEGGPEGGGGGPRIDLDSEEYQAAEEKCSPILDDAIGQIEVDPEVVAEQREQMLAYAECMREQGIDFPDPQFDDNGGMSVQIGDPDDEGAQGPDPEEMEAANEVCGDIMGDMAPAVVGNGPDGDDD